jgi:protein TonB
LSNVTALTAIPKLPVEITVAKSVPRAALQRPASAAARPRAPIPWKRLLLWSPVALGLIAGIFWDPEPLRRQPDRRVARTTTPAAPERAVFTAPDIPVVLPAIAPEPESEPKPAVQERARVAEPPPERRKLRLTPPEPPRPQLSTDLPAVPQVASAYRSESAQALRFEVAPRLASATLEPPRVSTLRRTVGSIPGFGFLKKKGPKRADFVPARPLRQVRPATPPNITQDIPVRVKLLIDESGAVFDAEILDQDADIQLGRIAVEAARRWRFEPAKQGEVPVESEMVVQFRFGPGIRNL